MAQTSVAKRIIGGPDLAELLVDYVYRADYDAIPVISRRTTKLLILDTLGAAIAGRFADGCAEVENVATQWGGSPVATIIGSGRKVPAHNAAMVNATMARALEIDEAHEKALLHAAATMLPVSIAAAEKKGSVDGRELIAAICIGIDLAARLSLAPQYSVVGRKHEPRGMSYTYQSGILVGSLIAGKVLGFDREHLLNALGIGYSLCAGNQEGLVEGVLAVRVQQGLTAQAALMAADLAAAGITGARRSLEGKFGYFNTFHRGRYDRDVIIRGLGVDFETENVSIKPFPCCKATHTAITAALEARNAASFRTGDIDKVIVHVNNQEYFDVVCDPLEQKRNRSILAGPSGTVACQFNLPYVVAAALVRGRVTLAEFSQSARRDPEILDLMDRIVPVMDPGSEQDEGRILPTPGKVDIYANGSKLPISSGYARLAKGHPENPMSADEIVMKFRDLAAGSKSGMSLQQAEKVITTVEHLEKSEDVRGLVDCLIW